MLVALVLAELVSVWPLAGSTYQWSRYLLGSSYGWFAGWTYIWTLVILMAATAYSATPFARSAYRQETEVRLAGDSTLLIWDAFSAGRVACGERFAFDGLYSRTRIFRDGSPEVVDGFELLTGGEPFGGYSYLGAAYALAPRDLDPLVEGLHEALSRMPRARVGQRTHARSLCCPDHWPRRRRHCALSGAEHLQNGGAGSSETPARSAGGMVATGGREEPDTLLGRLTCPSAPPPNR